MREFSQIISQKKKKKKKKKPALMKFIVFNREGKHYRVNVNPDRYVKDLKYTIQDNEGTPFEKQILILDCKRLEDNSKLLDCNLYEEAEILLVNSDQSLLLKPSPKFIDFVSIDRIHQSFIDLQDDPKETDVINLMIDAISYLDDNIDFYFQKELFSLILSCFSYFPNKSIDAYGKRLKTTLSINHILLFPSILSYLAQYCPTVPITNYNPLISKISNELIPQIAKPDDQSIIIFGCKVPHHFRVTLFTDIILLTDFTEENLKIFVQFFFSHDSIPNSKMNFFFSKIVDANLFNTIPIQQFIDSNIYLDFTLNNLADFISKISEQTFVKILPIIDDKIIKKSQPDMLTTNFSLTVIFKCAKYDIKFDSIPKLLESLLLISEDMSFWDYLAKQNVKLTDKIVSKVKSFPRSPSIVKVLPIKMLPSDFVASTLLKANDFSFYKNAFSSKSINSNPILLDISFWNHLLLLALTQDCDEELYGLFASRISEVVSKDEINNFFMKIIVDKYPPKERQSLFLLNIISKLPYEHRIAYFDNQNSSYVTDFVQSEIIPPLSLCKLFSLRFVPSHTDISFLYKYQFSHLYRTSNLKCSIKIIPLTKLSYSFLTNFIRQKNNIDLISSADSDSFCLIASALIFTNNSPNVTISELSVKNILPFFAIAFNNLNKCNAQNLASNTPKEFMNLFIESIDNLVQDHSNLQIESINSLLSNIDILFNPNYFSLMTTLNMFDILFKFLHNSRIYVDLKLLIISIFKLSSKQNHLSEKIEDIFAKYEIDLMKLIINNISIIVNDDMFESNKLNFYFFNTEKISNFISETFQKQKNIEDVFQLILFFTKYCINLPDFKLGTSINSNVNKLFQEKYVSKKWDDVLVVEKFMETQNIKINMQILICKYLHFDTNKNIVNPINVATLILNNPQPEKHQYLFKTLFNVLMKNTSIAYQYISIFLDKNVSNQALDTSTIENKLAFLYDGYDDIFSFMLNHFFVYDKDNSVFVRKIKIRPITITNINFTFLEMLKANINFQSFFCMQNIAYSFPFIFDQNPNIVINTVLPFIDCFSEIFDSKPTENTIFRLKTACSALSFLFSCLYSTNFIYVFTDFYFQHILKQSNSIVFGLTSIILALFKTQEVNLIIFALSIKYDFLSVISSLLLRSIPKGSFKESYMNLLYSFLNRYFDLIPKINYDDAFFINQVSNNSIVNPFIIKFNNSTTISRITMQSLKIPIPRNKSYSDEINNFINSINQVQPFWITCDVPLAKYYSNKQIKKPVHEFFSSLSLESAPSKIISDHLPPIPPMSVKMYNLLVSQQNWVFNWIKNDEYFPRLQDHQEILVKVIDELNKLKEDKDYVPFNKKFNPYTFFLSLLCHKTLTNTFVKKSTDDENSSNFLIRLFNLIYNNSHDANLFISRINDIIINIAEYSYSTKLLNSLISLVLSILQQNQSARNNFNNSYFGTFINTILTPDFRKDENLLLAATSLFSLYDLKPPDYLCHLVGFILLSNNKIIFPQLAEICAKLGEQKVSCIQTILCKSFNNLIASKPDIQFSEIQFYLDRIPLLLKGDTSMLETYINKIISQIKCSNYTDRDNSNLLIQIINYLTPKRSALIKGNVGSTRRTSLKFNISKQLMNSQQNVSKLTIYQAPQSLVETSPFFWNEIYNNHPFFFSDFINKDHSNIKKLKLFNEYFELLPFKLRYSNFKNNLRDKLADENINTNSSFPVFSFTIPTNLRRPIMINVSRSENLLIDSFNVLKSVSSNDLLGNFCVKFTNEEGSDAGGLTEEWFSLFVKELLNPQNHLFKQDANENSYPNPASGISRKDHLEYFRIAGSIIGVSMLKERQLRAHFSIPFLRQILHQETSLRDLEEYDEEVYNSLISILNADNFEDLDLRFQIDDISSGQLITIDLIENGENVAVTKENVEKYVNLYADYKLRKSMIEQINAFSKGFDAFIQPNYIKMFSPIELDMLICGIPNINIKDLRENARYHGFYHKDHPTIKLFFSVIEKWEQEDLAKLLMFITGTSQVPLKGFKDKPIEIAPLHDKRMLPQSHTCFRRIDIPAYDTEEDMNNKLYYAIQQEGYGLD